MACTDVEEDTTVAPANIGTTRQDLKSTERRDMLSSAPPTKEPEEHWPRRGGVRLFEKDLVVSVDRIQASVPTAAKIKSDNALRGMLET